MADTAAWVRNQNGAEVAAAGDAFVYFLTPEQEFELEGIVDDGEGDFEDFFDDLPGHNIAVGRLVAIVEAAQAVLDGVHSPQALHRLAEAIEGAGFVGEGFYTSLFTGDEADEDAD